MLENYNYHVKVSLKSKILKLYGCFHKLGARFVSVLVLKAVRPRDLLKRPMEGRRGIIVVFIQAPYSKPNELALDASHMIPNTQQPDTASAFNCFMGPHS